MFSAYKFLALPTRLSSSLVSTNDCERKIKQHFFSSASYFVRVFCAGNVVILLENKTTTHTCVAVSAAHCAGQCSVSCTCCLWLAQLGHPVFLYRQIVSAPARVHDPCFIKQNMKKQRTKNNRKNLRLVVRCSLDIYPVFTCLIKSAIKVTKTRSELTVEFCVVLHLRQILRVMMPH